MYYVQIWFKKDEDRNSICLLLQLVLLKLSNYKPNYLGCLYVPTILAYLKPIDIGKCVIMTKLICLKTIASIEIIILKIRAVNIVNPVACQKAFKNTGIGKQHQLNNTQLQQT